MLPDVNVLNSFKGRQGGLDMCIGKEGENDSLKRHMKDVPGWLRSKKRLVTTALDLARPGVSPRAARLAQSEETSERHVQASYARKQAASA